VSDVPAQERKIRRAEMLHEAAQDHIARVTDGKDDLCIREQPPDHRQTQQVQRILIYQSRAGLAGDAVEHFAPVFGANVLQLRGAQRREPTGVLHTLSQDVIERLLQEGLFVERLKLLVSIQHHFQKCRARTRKAHDEDRTFRPGWSAGVVPTRDIRRVTPKLGDRKRLGMHGGRSQDLDVGDL